MSENHNKNQKIRYRSRINLNIGMIALGIILVYLFINIVLYFTTDRISYYEVVAGSNSEDLNSSYVGIALRDETVYTSKTSGYIDYYVSECSRVSKNTTLYSVDSKGSLNELLSEATSNDTKLNEENISTISDLVNQFSNDFSMMQFSDVYSFKTMLKGTVVDLVNMNKLKQLAKEKGETFSINKSSAAGVVLYRIDDYEQLKKNQLQASDFDRSNYILAQFSTGSEVENGSPIYKIVNSEEWSIAVPFTKEQAKEYKDVNGIEIKFLKDDVTTTANLEIVKGKDKNNYGIISLSKYMVRYATDRFLEIQILNHQTNGLKIPKSSLVTKNLYVIPKEYGAEGGGSDETNVDNIGFNLRKEDGDQVKNEIYYPTISYSDENNYYVSTKLFQKGDVLYSMDMKRQYTIGKTQEFVGVYSINNGYTLFVRVNILEILDEYYIVEDEKIYGLTQYDRIVLDGSQVSENQIVAQ